MATQSSTDPQRGSRDSDPMHSGDKSHLKNLGAIPGPERDSDNDAHAGSGGGGTSDLSGNDNDHNTDAGNSASGQND